MLPPRHRRKTVGDGTKSAGSCKTHPLKWRHHSRWRLGGSGLSQQLQFVIVCFIELWYCRGLINNYRVKSPLQIVAFIYQRLVHWRHAEGWASAFWLWLIIDASDSFHGAALSYKNKNNSKPKTSFCHSHAVWSGQNLLNRCKRRGGGIGNFGLF